MIDIKKLRETWEPELGCPSLADAPETILRLCAALETAEKRARAQAFRDAADYVKPESAKARNIPQANMCERLIDGFRRMAREAEKKSDAD